MVSEKLSQTQKFVQNDNQSHINTTHHSTYRPGNKLQKCKKLDTNGFYPK